MGVFMEDMLLFPSLLLISEDRLEELLECSEHDPSLEIWESTADEDHFSTAVF